MVSQDIRADQRFTASPLLLEKGVVSAAAVVIAGYDEPYGALGVFSQRRRDFSADDLNSLQAVANVISTAMERVAAERRLEEVRDAERSRIARDLHDEALQGLTHALALTGGRDSNRDKEVSDILQGVGRQLRGAIYDLRLEDSRERPFAEALPELVEVHGALVQGCEVLLETPDGLPPGSFGRRGTEVLRIISESLTNARRHAGARRIVVRVSGRASRLCMEVTDDGQGFEVDRQPSPFQGQGLRGMRERAEKLGGHLDVHSDASGTTVKLQAELEIASASETTRILLVEDHAAVRQALAAALERERDIEVAGQAASLAEARTQLEGIDVAIIDLGLPDGFGADLIKDLRRANPRAQALVLSGALDRAETARAVARGAAGVLDKTEHLQQVVSAVHRLRDGETLLPLEEIVALLRYAGDQREIERDEREALAQLTPREREVLQAVADGLNSQEIADRLHIAVRTERNHIANILAKLGAHSQIQALLLALRYGIVEVPSRRDG
jgi:DNA-binding NarL/FixJ family response regulator/signal transduction histidine kinase